MLVRRTTGALFATPGALRRFLGSSAVVEGQVYEPSSPEHPNMTGYHPPGGTMKQWLTLGTKSSTHELVAPVTLDPQNYAWYSLSRLTGHRMPDTVDPSSISVNLEPAPDATLNCEIVEQRFVNPDQDSAAFPIGTRIVIEHKHSNTELEEGRLVARGSPLMDQGGLTIRKDSGQLVTVAASSIARLTAVDNESDGRTYRETCGPMDKLGQPVDLFWTIHNIKPPTQPINVRVRYQFAALEFGIEYLLSITPDEKSALLQARIAVRNPNSVPFQDVMLRLTTGQSAPQRARYYSSRDASSGVTATMSAASYETAARPLASRSDHSAPSGLDLETPIALQHAITIGAQQTKQFGLFALTKSLPLTSVLYYSLGDTAVHRRYELVADEILATARPAFNAPLLPSGHAEVVVQTADGPHTVIGRSLMRQNLDGQAVIQHMPTKSVAVEYSHSRKQTKVGDDLRTDDTNRIVFVNRGATVIASLEVQLGSRSAVKSIVVSTPEGAPTDATVSSVDKLSSVTTSADDTAVVHLQNLKPHEPVLLVVETTSTAVKRA